MAALHKLSLVHRLYKIWHTQVTRKARAARHQGKGRARVAFYAHEGNRQISNRGKLSCCCTQAGTKSSRQSPWLAVYRAAKVKLRELCSIRTQQAKSRKALCVLTRGVTTKDRGSKWNHDASVEYIPAGAFERASHLFHFQMMRKMSDVS